LRTPRECITHALMSSSRILCLLGQYCRGKARTSQGSRAKSRPSIERHASSTIYLRIAAPRQISRIRASVSFRFRPEHFSVPGRIIQFNTGISYCSSMSDARIARSKKTFCRRDPGK
jgi:hypothetical protein